jgi:outer membrane protein OmpA-like peptidoglycan-associated protein
VTGFTDTSGPNQYNDGLSRRRAQNVANLLQGAGVDAADLTVDGRGETQLKVETQDGVREPMNRRVEINAETGGQ